MNGTLGLQRQPMQAAIECEWSVDPRLDVIRMTLGSPDQRYPNSGKAHRWITQKLVSICRESNCYRVMVEAYPAYRMDLLSNQDAAARLRQLGMTGQFRIAWVDSDPVTADGSRFLESVLVLSGFPVLHHFDEPDPALRWLCEQEVTPPTSG